MSVSFAPPNPVLVINDETGEWVLTKNIAAVAVIDSATRVYILNGESSGRSYVWSPLSPSELRKRLFDYSIGEGV